MEVAVSFMRWNTNEPQTAAQVLRLRTRCRSPHTLTTMSTGETAAHCELKRLALVWAQQHGYTAVATEVRLPQSGFRADVAAYRSLKRDVNAEERSLLGTTAVFECKQAREDFLKDSYSRDGSLLRLRELDLRRRKLEDLLKLHLPSLRKGESLFVEFDAVDLRGMEHKTYRRVLREIETLQRRVYGKTKFERLMKYRCANVNYLVVDDGLLAARESPWGWGLLVRRRGVLELDVKPVWQEVPEHDRLTML